MGRDGKPRATGAARSSKGDNVNHRGRYAAIFCAIVDDPDFRRLSRDARDAFMFGMRLAPDNNRAGIFSVFHEEVAERGGVPLERMADVMRELAESPTPSDPWIVAEGRWVWIRNQVRFDPGYNAQNENHVKGLVACLSALPRGLRLLPTAIAYLQGFGLLWPHERLLPIAPWLSKLRDPLPFPLLGRGPTALPFPRPVETVGDTVAKTPPESVADTPPDSLPHGVPDPVAVSVAVAVAETEDHAEHEDTPPTAGDSGGGASVPTGTGNGKPPAPPAHLLIRHDPLDPLHVRILARTDELVAKVHAHDDTVTAEDVRNVFTAVSGTPNGNTLDGLLGAPRPWVEAWMRAADDFERDL